MSLTGKHIIVGITGGIAAYKTATLVRLLVKGGAEVQVIMTPNAKEFICPVTLSTLSGKPVISEFFTANTGQWNSHVDLGLWADAIVIAPATASTIGKMANGVADNMLVTTYLSAKAPVFVAPAMDLDMMAHPSTTRNINLLRSYGNHIIEPAEGELASHLVGKGRMEEPENIAKVLSEYFEQDKPLKGKKIMITAGPTYERIDPVRFIGNYSTGKMGYAIADEAARRGAEVLLISGPVAIRPESKEVKVIDVESAREMYEECHKHFADCDIAIMTAAVADYAPATVADKKIKREKDEIPQIELVKNPDIAASLGASKRPGQLLVGFALETNDESANALDKLQRKNLDMIVMNSLRDAGAGFGTDTNKITLFKRDTTSRSFPLKSKKEVAADILDEVALLVDTTD
ncbi:MAG: bifunctional phosphopantothenoylcysteine decarboxylase/phosphopantothenate--cysteine ligase CoaBC [Barnesiella sp.]|nr:bifunctional phosphopantothenoylcysteine decarboxylase/phosphopantothenate--cysteine ligase CoaBC [Barnesiella sp.]